MRYLMLNWRDPRNPMAGGAERVTFRYLRALQDRGHDVCWFANQFPGGAESESVDGVRVVRGGGRGTSIPAAIQWHQRQPPFDLVIDQHHGIPWYAPWWSRTPCVAYIHEVLGPIWHSFYPWPLAVIGRFQEWLTHVQYSGIPFWTPSQSTCKRLQARGVERVQVFPNGIDLAPLPSLEAKPFQQPIRLITVSRLAPNKQIEHAVEMLALIKRKGIDSSLTIVGDGESKSSIQSQVQELGLDPHVQFTGRVSEEEKNRLLAGAHLLLHPSLREGWGLNVIEANAMGTPALVYPVDGLVDSTVHETTGLITEQATPASLVKSLESLLEEQGLYDRLRTQAWKRSFEFQWNSVLPAACDWLEQVAGSHGACPRSAPG